MLCHCVYVSPADVQVPHVVSAHRGSVSASISKGEIGSGRDFRFNCHRASSSEVGSLGQCVDLDTALLKHLYDPASGKLHNLGCTFCVPVC